ncbi:nicotinate phosphoribosyltransferase [Bremerella sp. T1]|uniref:nicotinate phosphoribosyltransferase n=1 Tax=Bremerella sp. TYQ1 TaxID=3119568 RepID=UPI001CCE0DC8|nr:nicotinate phosphoribosyltransferase [Bremerella volcania]UBM37156.1 nicotinate phosphoribosyltransferase [Bremerella volcania]
MLSKLYRPPLALLTDLYQLTMAYGYWKLGRADQHAVFHLFFRKPPFGGGYAIAAGLEQAVEYLESFRFDSSDAEYLAELTGNDDQPLFEPDFLDALTSLKLTVDVDAMPEGTVAFGQEPMLRVRGPIMQCQLLETPLLNMINFQTLIATKASRIRAAAGNDPVLEFGLRRAQGIDGAISASRAAYIGGASATSNVLAGKLYGIPVKGTHAHSWVMSFDTEMEAFEKYAEVMPNNCVFLADTYDTLDGVRQACEVGKRLRQRGHEMVGIRLDSGDLAYLSIEARKILDEAGFPQATIVASNDLNENIMESLKNQGAQIAVWGVGTKLATAYDQPALGGVYKLAAMQRPDGTWEPKVKLSEQAIKTSIPGMLQVRRYRTERGMIGDMVFDENRGVDPRAVIVDSKDTTRRKRLAHEADAVDLLQPILREGKRTAEKESLETIRERALLQIAEVHPTIRRFMNPHEYPVGLDIGLHELRDQMIHEMRGSQLTD